MQGYETPARIRAYQIIQDQGRGPASANERPVLGGGDQSEAGFWMLTDVLVVMVMMGRKVVSSEEATGEGTALIS